jgi:MOSC domain-containing protein YiiM
MSRRIVVFKLIVLICTSVTSFLQPLHYRTRQVGGRCCKAQLGMSSWLDSMADKLQKVWNLVSIEDESTLDPITVTPGVEEGGAAKRKGRIIRTALRTYDTDSSRPSSRTYTTRKNSQLSVTISVHGIEGDYNHYRTIALQSTPNRAVSILTEDSMIFLRSVYPTSQNGDLGENLTFGGLKYSDLMVGVILLLGETVRLQITEPIEPCANLCKLPYINSDALKPKQRIIRCHEFLQKLDVSDGLRGWYAKVLNPGLVHVGDVVSIVA